MSVKFLRKFREWREQAGYSQEAISDMLAIRQSNISKIERDAEGKRFQWDQMARIHAKTGVDLNYLADDSQLEKPTREYMAKLAEVQRAVKLLGVDEVLRRLSDMPRQEYYPNYAPAPPPLPAPAVHQPVPTYAPVDPRHFNTRAPIGVVGNRQDAGAWMDVEEEDDRATKAPKRPDGRKRR